MILSSYLFYFFSLFFLSSGVCHSENLTDSTGVCTLTGETPKKVIKDSIIMNSTNIFRLLFFLKSKFHILKESKSLNMRFKGFFPLLIFWV